MRNISEYKNKLMKEYVNQKLFGYDFYVSKIEEDGRRTKRLQKDLLEAGYLNIVNGKISLSDKILEEVEDGSFDFFEKWEQSRHSYNNRPDPIPAIKLVDLSFKERCYLLTRDDVLLYHYDSSEVHFKSEITFKEGPFTFSDELPSVFRADRKVSDLFFTTQELEKKIKDVVYEESINRMVASNFAWGLEDQGILKPGENDVDSEGNQKYLHSSLHLPTHFSPSYGDLSFKTEEWESKLDEHVSRCLERVQFLTENLRILEKAKFGIEQIGGMDVFIQRLRERIEEEIDKQSTDEANYI